MTGGVFSLFTILLGILRVPISSIKQLNSTSVLLHRSWLAILLVCCRYPRR